MHAPQRELRERSPLDVGPARRVGHVVKHLGVARVRVRVRAGVRVRVRVWVGVGIKVRVRVWVRVRLVN